MLRSVTATPEAAVDAAALRSWLAQEEEQLALLQERLKPLLQEQRRLQARLLHLRELLATYDTTFPSEAVEAVASAGTGLRESTGNRVRRQVAEILGAQNEPMHILDVWQQFRDRSWPVPGAGNAANITAHLSSAPEFYSPRRGYYRLRSDGDPASEPRKPVRRKGAKRSSKGSAN
jgi:hypothetical protein